MAVPGEDPQKDLLQGFRGTRKILITATGTKYNTSPQDNESVENIIEGDGGFILEWINELQGIIKFKFCGAWTVEGLMQTMNYYSGMLNTRAGEKDCTCIIDLSMQDPELFPGASVIKAFPKLYDIFKRKTKFMLIVLPNFDSMISNAAKIWNSTVMRNDSEIFEVEFNCDKDQLVLDSLTKLSQKGHYSF